MEEEKQLSATELEQLLQLRRRQEAVAGLRLLPLVDKTNDNGKDRHPKPAGLARPGVRPAPPTLTVTPPILSAAPAVPMDTPAEEWLQPPRAQLQPLAGRRRARRRPTHPLLRALQKGLDRIVDTLIVLVLILFVLALGFWLYDTYLDPFLRRIGGTGTPSGQHSTALWPGQGRLSSPEEALTAPLPYVPYSTTMVIQNPDIPPPTPAPGTALPSWMDIPSIQLSTPVVEVTIQNGVWQVAEYAAGYHRGTARPGTVGNTVISGHKGLSGAVFARLDEVPVGALIYVTAGSRRYEYTVVEKKSVWPHQVEVMAPSSQPILTLITCTAYDTQRLIVVARFVREYPVGTSSSP